MNTSRRNFLRGATGALALGAAGTARAAGGLIDRPVPGTTTPYKVLEIFFAGGLSHRETLWVERPAPAGAPADWLGWLPARGAHEGTSYKLGRAGGRDIHLGPCAEPLVRPLAAGGRLKDRLRVIATGHEINGHPPAQDLMQQGAPSSTSRDRASGVGAAIARHTSLPSYVFYNSRLTDPAVSAQSAAASGRHGEHNSPRLIPYDNPEIVSLLGAPRDPERDALGSYYGRHYESGLTFASGQRARSVSLDRYLRSRQLALAGPEFALALSALTASSGETLWDNGTRRALLTSISLLDAGLSSYCGVMDGGVVGDDSTFSQYDSHDIPLDQLAAVTTANVLNVLRTLREAVDAGTLDLDTTLVVLNTEFGRSFSQGVGSHH
jgi:hypothetical protein